jgi:hypothetical protein
MVSCSMRYSGVLATVASSCRLGEKWAGEKWLG